MPGETMWMQAREKLAPMAVGPLYMVGGEQGITMYEITYRIPEGVDFPRTQEEGAFTSYYFDPLIFVQGDRVIALYLSAGWIKEDFNYSLAGLLRLLGKPEEIWLKFSAETPSEYAPEYVLHLFYPTKGILLSSGGEVLLRDDRRQICPQLLWDAPLPPAILLWASGQSIPFLDIGKDLLGGIR